MQQPSPISFRPPRGARLLKRRIRSEVESPLANALLKGEVLPGDKVRLGFDPVRKAMRIDKAAEQGEAATEPGQEAAEAVAA